MFYDGDFVFAIYDENLDFDHISKHMKMMPVSITKRGQQITKNKKAPFDSWRYKQRIYDWEKMDEPLVELLDELLEHRDFISTLQGRYKTVRITCYLRSELAQIGFVISANSIEKLNQLGIDLGFDIFSFSVAE